MRRYALRDDQWDRIKEELPGREGHVGVTAKDNRLFVEAVLYRYRAGIPWRDLPERFGDPIKIHMRFSRWAKSGVWKRMFEMLAADADNEYAMIDSTMPISTAPAPKKRRRRPGDRPQQRGIEHQNPHLGRRIGQSHRILSDARPSPRPARRRRTPASDAGRHLIGR